jgi:dATP pyrophosphohydrolase
MTRIETGVVDVHVIRPRPDGWRVLVLQRSAAVRCPGAWEAVHGSMDAGETPPQAARRELREETGLDADRLYSITVQPFYVVKSDTVQLAIVFAAFVGDQSGVILGEEHAAF